MRRLSDSEREELVRRSVQVMDDARVAFLVNGGSALKQWDLLEARAKSATRRTSSVGEWVTELYKGLQLGPPRGESRRTGNSPSLAIHDLEETVRAWACAEEWLDLLTREMTLMIATARIAVDERREAREQAEGLAAVELARKPRNDGSVVMNLDAGA